MGRCVGHGVADYLSDFDAPGLVQEQHLALVGGLGTCVCKHGTEVIVSGFLCLGHGAQVLFSRSLINHKRLAFVVDGWRTDSVCRSARLHSSR